MINKSSSWAINYLRWWRHLWTAPYNVAACLISRPKNQLILQLRTIFRSDRAVSTFFPPYIMPKGSNERINSGLRRVPKSPVYIQACPYIRAFVENRPYFCDFSRQCLFKALLSCLENRSITLWTCSKSQNDGKCTYFRPSNAHIFAKKAPVFRPYFYKNELVWRIGC